jgi:hypothetical protein
VVLIKEEMRRVLISHEYVASIWDTRARRACEGEDELAEGRCGYALKQARIRRALIDRFKKMWAKAANSGDIEKADEADDGSDTADSGSEDSSDGEVDWDGEGGGGFDDEED